MHGLKNLIPISEVWGSCYYTSAAASRVGPFSRPSPPCFRCAEYIDTTLVPLLLNILVWLNRSFANQSGWRDRPLAQRIVGRDLEGPDLVPRGRLGFPRLLHFVLLYDNLQPCHTCAQACGGGIACCQFHLLTVQFYVDLYQSGLFPSCSSMFRSVPSRLPLCSFMFRPPPSFLCRPVPPSLFLPSCSCLFLPVHFCSFLTPPWSILFLLATSSSLLPLIRTSCSFLLFP